MLLPGLRPLIADIALAVKAQVGAVADGLSLPVTVTDGLGAMLNEGYSARPVTEIRLERLLDHTRIRTLRLLHPCRLRSARLPDCKAASVRCGEFLRAPASRSLAIPSLHRSRVSGAALDAGQRTVHDGIPTSFASGVSVLQATSRIRAWPHTRKAENPEDLSVRQCASFLREAEVLREVPHGQGELLGVFRHVPIEVVAKIRFLEKRRLLIYTLFPDPELRRTRVHDIGVVRDRSNNKIQIVAHRTQYRTAFLA